MAVNGRQTCRVLQVGSPVARRRRDRCPRCQSSVLRPDRADIPAPRSLRHVDLINRVGRRGASRGSKRADDGRERSAAASVNGEATGVGRGEQRSDSCRRCHRQRGGTVSRSPVRHQRLRCVLRSWFQCRGNGDRCGRRSRCGDSRRRSGRVRGVPSRRLHMDVQQTQCAQGQQCKDHDVRQFDGSTERPLLPCCHRGDGRIGIARRDNRRPDSVPLIDARGLHHVCRRQIGRRAPCRIDIWHVPGWSSRDRRGQQHDQWRRSTTSY